MKVSMPISKLVTLTMLTLGLGFFSEPMGKAQNRVLNNAELKGAYGICLTFGANDGAGVAVVTADGNGSLRDGWVLLNVPNEDEEGGILRGQVVGAYEINPNGTATVTLRFILPDKVVDRAFDLIVQELDQSGIIELAGALRETTTLVPGKGATIELERLPEGGFDNSSVQGPVTLELGFKSQAATAFGVVTADGQGKLEDGSLLINATGDDGQRIVVKAQLSGSYSVTSDGRLTLRLMISLPNQTPVEATVQGAVLEAEDVEVPTETKAHAKMRMIRKVHFAREAGSGLDASDDGLVLDALGSSARRRLILQWGNGFMLTELIT